MTFPESEDELRGELSRIGAEEFRRKHGPKAHTTHPAASFAVTKHILEELDRKDRSRHERVMVVCTVLITLATIATAIGVFAVR